MKQFISKVLKTSVFFLTGLILLISLTHVIVKIFTDFQIPQNNKYIILGHSHPNSAFDDSLVDSTLNLSSAAESYFYSYQKLKEISLDNKINGMFIEYTNNQISEKMDDWIWGYEKMNQFLPQHSPFISTEDWQFLMSNESQNFFKVISTSTFKNLMHILTFNFSRGTKLGGYRSLEKTSTEEELKRESINNPEIKNSQRISNANIHYLEKITNYCRHRNIPIYFIRSPQYKYYVRSNERKLLAIKNQKFQNINFLDFDNFPLRAKHFADSGHLNSSGAKIFSKWFNNLLKKGLLTQKDKAKFVKDEMGKLKLQ